MLPQHQIAGSPAPGAASPQAIVMRGDAGEPVTTSTAIAIGTQVQHKNVIELVRRYQSDLESFGSVPFKTEAKPEGAHGGGPAVYAVLNEQQATLLIAFMRNSSIVVDFKVQLVRSFYEMRAALAGTVPAAPTTLRDALILALAQTEHIEQLEAKVSADAPKVAFAEAVRSVDGVCSIEKIAKTLGIGRNKFFRRLRDDNILLVNNLPYQKYIDREYFTVIEGAPYVDSKKVSHPTFTTMVTGAGQVFLARKYGASAIAVLAMQSAANSPAKEAA